MADYEGVASRAAMQVYGDGTLVWLNTDGDEVARLDAPPPEQRHTLALGFCDCCERVPAGRIARALELLDDDHPAAAVLRGRPAPPGPRPGGRREPTIGELGLCGPDPGDDEARWTPDSDR